MIQIPIFFLSLLAQVPQAASSGADAAGDAPQQAPGLFEGLGFFLPAMLAVMLVWLLFMPKPQQNQSIKTSDLLKKLKKNDRVITAGGILGTVANFGTEEEFVTLRIDDDKTPACKSWQLQSSELFQTKKRVIKTRKAPSDQFSVFSTSKTPNFTKNI